MNKISLIVSVIFLLLFSSCVIQESTNSCNYDIENRLYVGKNNYECSHVGYRCDFPDQVRFRDECGCGCEIIS